MRNRCYCLILFLLMTLMLWSQNDAQLSQYWALPGLTNPAAIAGGDKLTVAAIDRMQWVGVSNAPKTFMVSAETPFRLLRKKQGIGLVAVNDQAGLFSSTDFALQYAYRMRLWKGELSLGLRIGLSSQSFDGSKISIPDTPDHTPSDESIPKTSVSAMSMDFGVGAWYTLPQWYVGISSFHLSEPQIDLDEKSSVQLKRIYYLTAGGNILLRNPLLELQPSFLLKSTLQMSQLDMSVRLMYNKMFWGGVSYRWEDAVILMAGVQLKGIRFGYSYDISTSAMASVTSGSHELFASYALKLNLGPKMKNKHKSIRIL